MLLIVVFLVAGVFIEESYESNLPAIPDLPDINATAGQSVVFNFIENFNFSIEQCAFGIDAGLHVSPPNPILLLVFWDPPNLKTQPKDNRVSFVGKRNKYAWFKFVSLATNDTNSYRLDCVYAENGLRANASAKLYVQDSPDSPDSPDQPGTTTAAYTTTQATKATTSRSSKSNFIRGNFFYMEFLVMAAMMYFSKM